MDLKGTTYTDPSRKCRDRTSFRCLPTFIPPAAHYQHRSTWLTLRTKRFNKPRVQALFFNSVSFGG